MGGPREEGDKVEHIMHAWSNQVERCSEWSWEEQQRIGTLEQSLGSHSTSSLNIYLRDAEHLLTIKLRKKTRVSILYCMTADRTLYVYRANA